MGAALSVLGAVVLMTQVQVRASGQPATACGSAWDVVAGRTGWSQWWSADLADPAQGVGASPVRTARCPPAVNRRVVGFAVLAAGVVAAISVGEAVDRRQRRRQRPPEPRIISRFRLFGASLTVLGAVLTVAGLGGLGLLAADPRSSLFLYVDRTAVVLAGLLLVLPAVLLIALGRAASLAADYLTDRERDGEST